MGARPIAPPLAGATIPTELESVLEEGRHFETAQFAAGCFWSVHHTFSQVPGVLSVDSGYAGGKEDAGPPPSELRYDPLSDPWSDTGPSPSPSKGSVGITRPPRPPSSKWYESNHFAETVRVRYDRSLVTYGELVKLFFSMHDPSKFRAQGTKVRSLWDRHSTVHTPPACTPPRYFAAMQFT